MAPHRIDTHNHPYPAAYIEKTRDVLKATTHAFYDRIVQWQPSQTVEVMDKDGIAVAVLSIGTPSVWLGDKTASRALARACNDAAAKMQSDYKGRFGHFATIPLPDTDGSLREIEYLYDTLDADGIALTTNYDDKYPGDPAFAPVFDELNRRKAVAYFHPTAAPAFEGILPNIPSPMIEFPSDTTRAIVSLLFGGTLSRCPEVRFIFSHAGGTLPMLAGRIEGIARNRPDLSAKVPNGVMHEIKRLYYDIAGVTHPIAFNAAYQLVGASQLLLGTDYPFWDPTLASITLAKLVSDADERRAIERDNALRLLPRLATSA